MKVYVMPNNHSQFAFKIGVENRQELIALQMALHYYLEYMVKHEFDKGKDRELLLLYKRAKEAHNAMHPENLLHCGKGGCVVGGLRMSLREGV